MTTDGGGDEDNIPTNFERDRHVRYFVGCLRSPLPGAYTSLDTNRLTLVHFAVQALDLLGALDDVGPDSPLPLPYRDAIIDWIYSLLTYPESGPSPLSSNDDDGRRPSSDDRVGFKGGTFLGDPFRPCDDDEPREGRRREYDQGHVAMTYVALCTLVALGDDLSRVPRVDVIRSLRALQLDDGSYECVSAGGSERDVRFLYCACAISHVLDDWTGLDKERATQYVEDCRSWDGAIGLIPRQEGHGGSTFCGIASLVLMDKLDDVFRRHPDWKKELIYWCVSRQRGGMQGRPNKAEDTCYSYWIGGTLRLLQGEDRRDSLLDERALKRFVLGCQGDVGGFRKFMGAHPDLLHSFYSIAWLSLSSKRGDNNEGGGDDDETIRLHELDCALGVRKATSERIGCLNAARTESQ